MLEKDKKENLTVLYGAINVNGHQMTVDKDLIKSVKEMLVAQSGLNHKVMTKLSMDDLIKDIALTSILIDKYSFNPDDTSKLMSNALKAYLADLSTIYCDEIQEKDNRSDEDDGDFPFDPCDDDLPF